MPQTIVIDTYNLAARTSSRFADMQDRRTLLRHRFGMLTPNEVLQHWAESQTDRDIDVLRRNMHVGKLRLARVLAAG